MTLKSVDIYDDIVGEYFTVSVGNRVGDDDKVISIETVTVNARVMVFVTYGDMGASRYNIADVENLVPLNETKNF